MLLAAYVQRAGLYNKRATTFWSSKCFLSSTFESSNSDLSQFLCQLKYKFLHIVPHFKAPVNAKVKLWGLECGATFMIQTSLLKTDCLVHIVELCLNRSCRHCTYSLLQASKLAIMIRQLKCTPFLPSFITKVQKSQTFLNAGWKFFQKLLFLVHTLISGIMDKESILLIGLQPSTTYFLLFHLSQVMIQPYLFLWWVFFSHC